MNSPLPPFVFPPVMISSKKYKFSKVLHPLSLKVERENAVITVPKGVYEEYSCALRKIELHCVFKLMELVEYISMPVDDFLKMLGL